MEVNTSSKRRETSLLDIVVRNSTCQFSSSETIGPPNQKRGWIPVAPKCQTQVPTDDPDEVHSNLSLNTDDRRSRGRDYHDRCCQEGQIPVIQGGIKDHDSHEMVIALDSS